MKNDNRPVAIKISGVKKMYKLGQIGGGTLQADLQSWWARKRGKEDPNTKIGDNQRSNGQTFMALNGIDLSIYQGEAVGIIGSNGAGKSTLLKLLCRVTAPTEGEIDINGRIASMLEVGTGFNGEMTGRENVYMNGAILGMTKQEIDAKMEQIIEFSEVREFIDTPVKRYSSGMFVKLAFSVAAHLDSEIMIMDEVLAVGDMAFQNKCLNKMREAANLNGRTVLYVSHNMTTIRKLCDRCIVLDKGRVIFEGEVSDAIAIYLGNKSTSDAYVNLKDMPRDGEFRNHSATMTFLDTHKDGDVGFSLGEKVTMRIGCEASKRIDNAYIRFIIKTTDGEPVTMINSAQSGIVIDLGRETELDVEFSLSNIAPGKYTLSAVIYEVDEFGNYVSLDGLKDMYCFEIFQPPEFNNNINWESKHWGHLYSEPLKIFRH